VFTSFSAGVTRGYGVQILRHLVENRQCGTQKPGVAVCTGRLPAQRDAVVPSAGDSLSEADQIPLNRGFFPLFKEKFPLFFKQGNSRASGASLPWPAPFRPAICKIPGFVVRNQHSGHRIR
jgi:hypothetical protein